MPKKVHIKGAIIPNDSKWIYDLFEYDSTCPKDIEKAIDEANGEELEVIINSGGGSVYAGSEIYTLLKSYAPGSVGKIVGVAASAASVCAMGCKKLAITPTGQIMLHNVSSYAVGDHRDMQQEAKVLHGWDKSIANAYKLKTNLDEDTLLSLMNKETWLTAQQALDYKFVDEIMFVEEGQLVAAANEVEMLPQQVVNKLRQLLGNIGSAPTNGVTIKDLMGQCKKGDDPMTLEEILASLPEEQQNVIKDAIETSKTRATAELTEAHQQETEQLQNQIDALKAQITESSPSAEEEELLTNADPKIRALVEEARQKEAEAKARELTAQAELQKIKEAEELKHFHDVAASFDKLAIDADKMSSVFRNFARADKEGFEQLQAVLKAANECVSQGKLFDVVGSANATGQSAWDMIQQKVNGLMQNDSALTQPQALARVLKDNKELYESYKKEMQEDE